jgi:ribonucleotide monophosphatase NagD (HAD superfamily)
MTTILVKTGVYKEGDSTATHIVQDFEAAVDLIFKIEKL